MPGPAFSAQLVEGVLRAIRLKVWCLGSAFDRSLKSSPGLVPNSMSTSQIHSQKCHWKGSLQSSSLTTSQDAIESWPQYSYSLYRDIIAFE